jgi:AraC family transcriptional regulator, transcriptional activator of pobA
LLDLRSFLNYLRLMVTLARLDRYQGGVPVYRYVLEPETPPVTVLRMGHEVPRHDRQHPHIHDFPALLYVDRDNPPRAGPEATGAGWTQPRAGELYVVAPGNVVRPPDWSFRGTATTAVFFAPEAVGEQGVAPPSWRSHPLLFPFVHGTAAGLLRLRVPEAERPEWSRMITAIETELTRQQDGYRQAVLAHLTLLLVSVARLASDRVGDLRRSNERLLADVFAVIEARYPRRLSLRDVAREVNLTPGHLTTAVRRRTGRTVQDWILERRMTEARRLLVETDLPVGEVGRRVGLPDSGYFARTFRREHGLSPRQWRAAAGRPEGPAARRGATARANPDPL